jgi:hypothetical protein
VGVDGVADLLAAVPEDRVQALARLVASPHADKLVLKESGPPVRRRDDEQEDRFHP